MKKILQKLSDWYAKLAATYNKTISYLKYLRGLALFLWRRTLPHLKKFHFNAFPSVRLKDFNRVDLFLKFSSELILLLMAIMVAMWNFYFFHIGHNFTDTSHAARVIASKQDLNPKLYAKMSVINTVILNSSTFVPQAQAEEFISADQNAIYDEADPTDSLVLNNDSIVQPNPDSVQQLVAKQVKVYQTKNGDTLKQIAADNGISVQTIIWANKLTSTAIKPGWFLIILPTNGILVKAADNDTLPDIAHRYNPEKYNNNAQTREDRANKLLDTIIAYNGLANAEDINPGDLLIVPGGVIPAPPGPKPAPKNSDGKINAGGVQKPSLIDYGTGHIFPWGYCTWYVASKVHVSWGGNAKSWLANAKAAGRAVTNHAMPGAIVVTTESRRYGHVAIVESVNASGFTVSEMNYSKFGKIDTRFIPHGSGVVRGFIIP